MTKRNATALHESVSRRRFLAASGALGLSVALSGCSGRSSRNGGILRVRNYTDLASLDPLMMQSQGESLVADPMFRKLISLRPGSGWDWQLDAAESIERLDDTHIRFRLRRDILFSDGFGEMTSEDVKFSFERIVDPANQSLNRGDWGTLERVDLVDRYTGVLVLREPFEPLWIIALPYWCGYISSKKAMESVGGRFGIFPPCVSGPYRLEEWRPKERTILVPNLDWSGEPPDFEEIHIFPIDDEKIAEFAFEAGELDFTEISVASLEPLRRNPPPGTIIEDYQSISYVWLGMNLDHPDLQDLRVRRAVQHAVDVPSVLKAAYFGAVAPATGLIAPGLVGHRERSIVPPEADPMEARRLLEVAGHPNGIDLTLDCQNKTDFFTAAQVIQANLAEVGIRLQINLHESGTMTTLGRESAGERWREIQLFLQRYSMVPDPYYATEWFVTDQVGEWNWERFRSDEFDQLHHLAAAEADIEERAAMYRRMQDLMEESGAYRFLTHEARPVAYRDTITPALRPDGVPLLHHFKKAPTRTETA